MARVDDPYHLLDRAVEYYVAGRFAALNNLQIAANLFHHAFEMLVKFQLLRGFRDDSLATEAEKLQAGALWPQSKFPVVSLQG